MIKENNTHIPEIVGGGYKIRTSERRMLSLRGCILFNFRKKRGECLLAFTGDRL